MIEIKHRHTGTILASRDLPTLKEALEACVRDGADLGGADLGGADLGGADLGGADLYGADLYGADLRDAYLGEHGTLIGRGALQIVPIGSRDDVLIAFYTTTGIVIRAGCFFDTLAAFVDAVAETHGDSTHAQHYMAAVQLIRAMAPED